MTLPPTPLDYGRPHPQRSRTRVLRWLIVVVFGLAVGIPVAAYIGRHGTSRNHLAAYNRAICMTNLHVIGTAIQLYMLDHGDTYPATLADLYAAEPDLGASAFCCPAAADTPATGPTTRATAAMIAAGGHCSYVYAGRGLTKTTAGPATVVAYEPLSNHGDGCHVLYGDGHVAWQSAPPTTTPAH